MTLHLNIELGNDLGIQAGFREFRPMRARLEVLRWWQGRAGGDAHAFPFGGLGEHVTGECDEAEEKQRGREAR